MTGASVDMKLGDTGSNIILSAFKSFENGEPMYVKAIREEHSRTSFILSGCFPHSETGEILKNTMGISDYMIDVSTQPGDLILTVGRIDVPKIIKFMDYLKFIKQNSAKGIFLGVSAFGPEYFPLESMTHAAITGSSGYGKSAFSRAMIAQMMAFREDCVVHIIDPKKDFTAYKGFSNIGFVAQSENEWISLLDALIIEFSVRQEIFQRSWKIPPENFNEYHRMKVESKRSDLPDLPRVFVFIEEFHALKELFYCGDYTGPSYKDRLHYLLRVARSSGIHMIFSSQNDFDFGRVSELTQTKFSFFTENQNTGYSLSSLQKLPLQGRMKTTRCDSEGDGFIYVETQAPYLSQEDANIVVTHYTKGAKTFVNYGFQRLRLRRGNALRGSYAQKIVEGKGFTEVFTMSEQSTRDIYPSRHSSAIHLLHDLY